MKRRNFIMKSAVVGLGLTTVGAYACNNLQVARAPLSNGLITEPFFKLSLAQWSLNQAIRGGSMDPYAFAAKSHELGFEGLEYVSQLTIQQLLTQTSLKRVMKRQQHMA